MAWEFTVAVIFVTAFFAGLFAAVYVAFAASALFNAQRLLVASEMAFLPAALIFRRLRFVGSGVVAGSAGPPESMARSSAT